MTSTEGRRAERSGSGGVFRASSVMSAVTRARQYGDSIKALDLPICN